MTFSAKQVTGEFECCPNYWTFAFKCSDCGHIMAYCIESSDLFPDLHNLKEIAVGVNSLDSSRPAFNCPRCGHSFEFTFLSNEAYRVTSEEMMAQGFSHLVNEP